MKDISITEATETAKAILGKREWFYFRVWGDNVIDIVFSHGRVLRKIRTGDSFRRCLSQLRRTVKRGES